MRVLSVASEAVPLVKTGGLADVVGALPGALAPHGIALTTLIPGYPAVMAAIGKARRVHAWPVLVGTRARLLAARLSDHPLLVLDAPALFRREGTPYADAAGNDWPDNWRRFAALSRAAAQLAMGEAGLPAFDILHAHDWQAGLAPAYLRFRSETGPDHAAPPSVMTIHNMAFQGLFPHAVLPHLDLGDEAWDIDGVEFWGSVGFLKAGIATADAVTTVSPTYADEIRRAEYGMGLEGLIAARAAGGQGIVHGIVNGIDTAEWNPAQDRALAARFTVRSLVRRAANRRALEGDFGLEADPASPLLIIVSRLTGQKGMDVVAQALDGIVAAGARLALLGNGDGAIETALLAGAARHPGRVGVRIGYDERQSHRMQGGGDAILIPSRFEPCGLTQLYALAYGCVPVVARTGGLADTVIDANIAALAAGVATGIQMSGVSPAELVTAVERTVALFRRPSQWQTLQKNGMGSDFSWTASGGAYAGLYARLTGGIR